MLLLSTTATAAKKATKTSATVTPQQGVMTTGASTTTQKRDSSWTYFTLPEWYIVDVTKDLGAFMDHTPWFNYPFFKVIGQFWWLLLQEMFIVLRKHGWAAALFSEYVLMDVVIGIILTLLFFLLAVLAVIPRWMYGAGGGDGTGAVPQIQAMIMTGTKTGATVMLPRYVPFTATVTEMALAGKEFISIAGCSDIQVVVRATDATTSCKISGVVRLFDFAALPSQGCEDLVALSVHVPQLATLARTVPIVRAYDF